MTNSKTPKKKTPAKKTPAKKVAAKTATPVAKTESSSATTGTTKPTFASAAELVKIAVQVAPKKKSFLRRLFSTK